MPEESESECVRDATLRTMLKNRVHTVLHRRGILTPTGGLFTKAGRAFLDELALDDAGRAILERFRRALEDFEALIESSNDDLKATLWRQR